MANDELWRWAEPDGKQREVTLEELRMAFSRGQLVTNTAVWKKGFSDWRPAVEVSELKASVLSGARVIAPKGAALPGRSVPQRGGAAATDDEPPSPPVYTPTPKPLPGRPSAPSLDLKGPDSDSDLGTRKTVSAGELSPVAAPVAPKDSGETRERAATLIIHAGAPPAQENVVPTTRSASGAPPKAGEGSDATPSAPEVATAAAGSSSAPEAAKAAAPIAPAPETPRVPVLDVPSATQPAATSSVAIDEAPSTKEVPVAAVATTETDAAKEVAKTAPLTEAAKAKLSVESTAKLPALVDSVPEPVSTSMILQDSQSSLPDSTGNFEQVSTANLLVDDSSPQSLEPASTEELSAEDLMPASKATLEKTVSLPPPLDKTVSMRPRQPSIPPPIPLAAQEAADRMGMGRLPPPDISVDDERAQRLAPTVRPGAEEQGGIPAGVPWALVIVALGAVGVGAYYMGRLGGDKPPVTPTANTAPTVVVVPTPTVTATAAPETPKEVRCKLVQNARSLAPKTIVSVGIDVAAAGDGFAVGYATSPRDAVAVRIDASSFAPLDMVRGRAPSDLRRVVPVFGDKLAVLGEIDTPVSGISKRRLARGSNGYVGLAKEHFVWGKTDSAPPEQLLTMASAKVEALRASAFSEGNVAFAYRSEGSIWVGTSQSGDVPQRFAGLGGGVGSPALVALGNSVLVVWADHKTAEDPWVLRIGEHRPGSSPPEPKLFISAGGLGGSRLSPSLAAVGDDRALVVWTDEGSRGGDIVHEVRGQLIDKKATAVGSAFSISMPDMNAGQPQVAISKASSGKDGFRGLAAFLVATDNGFEVAGAPLSCGQE